MDLTEAFSDSGGGFMDMIGKLFTGGGGGGGSNAPQQKDETPWWLPVLTGGGSMLASRLMGAGDQKNIDKMTKNLKTGSNIGTDAGKLMVDRASQGKLTDPQQATVDRMKDTQNARWAQYMSSLGIPVSSSMVQAQNLVDTQATELANKLINESFEQGLKALSLGGTDANVLLQSAMKSKSEMAKTIQDMMAEVGRVLNQPGRGGGQPGQPGGVQQQAQTAADTWGGSDVYDISSPEGMGY